MGEISKYEAVIGLEIHAQLQTNSKLFSGDSNHFEMEPNSNISPIVLAHPGTLPKTNKKAVEYAIKMGLACNCSIEKNNYFARKNYFYADLPKGYQISQHTTPICKGGYVTIQMNENEEKKIQLNRIHLEEDAGKSIHDQHPNYSLIDFNRAGTPLIEIVTEPCMNNSNEAYKYVNEIRKLVQWIDICNGNMEEGNLRCDANISIRKKGEITLGTKVEVKNLNSVRNIKKAIDFEIERMIALAEKGEKITQQTRSFDADTDTTFALREKEDTNDYRYFADPDLAPFYISDNDINKLKNNLPVLPNLLKQKFIREFNLSLYDADQLISDKSTATYFLNTTKFSTNHKAIANWINGPLKQHVNTKEDSFENLKLSPKKLALLIEIVENGTINFSTASTKILPVLLAEDKQPMQIAEELNLVQINNTTEIEQWISIVLSNMPDKVEEYKKGKKGLLGLFVGEVKKLSKGKADPKIATQLLTEKLQ